MSLNRKYKNHKLYFIICLISVSILFSSCNPLITNTKKHKINSTNISKKEDTIQSNLSEIKETGNTQGNIQNQGLYAKRNGWIYGLFKNGYLYRRSLDGKKLEKLSNEGVDYINIVGDYLFYRDINYDFSGIRVKNLSTICMMDIRTKKVKKVTDDNIDYFYLYKGKIYFSKVIEDNDDKPMKYEIYQMRLDGTSKKLIYSEKIKTEFPKEEFAVDDNYIYFLSTDNNSKIYKYNLKNKKIIDISKNFLKNNIKQVCEFIIDDNNIYFTVRLHPENNGGYPGDLYKMTKSGDEIKLLIDGTLSYFNVGDKWIYYTWSKQDDSNDKTYKMRKDGTDKIEISNKTTVNINIIDNMIYCNGGRSLVGLYKISTDGSGHYEMLN